MKTINFNNIDPNYGVATLVVILHGCMRRASNLSSVENVVRGAWPQADIYRPELPTSLFSMANPNSIVAKLLTDIDEKFNKAQRNNLPYKNIVLVGHSFGALLARKLYLVACGEVSRSPLEPEFRNNFSLSNCKLISPKTWAVKVSRIVLLAGMNRGWTISHHLSLKNIAFGLLGNVLHHIIHVGTRRTLLIFKVRRGSEFITQLRIQWLLMRRRSAVVQQDTVPNSIISSGNALTIQLLGSQDDIVSPDDNVDLVSGGDFIYLDVPYSGHANVVEMEDAVLGSTRANVFLQALCGSIEELKLKTVLPSDDRFAMPDLKITKIIFVIHGIRDFGYWTHKIARRVMQKAMLSRLGTEAPKWGTETSSYGYFPILPFIFTWYRRQKVEWFMDQYTEALARYPNASFSYVGHSNGTYLLTKALELYPCCSFDNIVLAGSVVRRDYDWQRFLKGNPPRIKAVLNFVATGDWVVAFFPKFFEYFNWQDLGSSGHDGFLITQRTPLIFQIEYVKGGHSAAIQESVWDTIAEFIVTGKVNISEVHPILKKRSTWIAILGRFPPLAWMSILIIVWSIWQIINFLICHLVPLTLQDFTRGFAMAMYFILLWLIITRV